jgi:hypothetical protein
MHFKRGGAGAATCNPMKLIGRRSPSSLPRWLPKAGYATYIRFIPPHQTVMIVMICGFSAVGATIVKAS